MVEPQSRLVVMGRVLGPYGVKGWVKVQPYTEATDGLAGYTAWWMKMASGPVEIEVEEVSLHGQHLVARLQGYLTREQATTLSGVEIAITRDALPEAGEGEFYRADLLDLKVINLAGEHLGTVKEIFENGAHDILRIASVGGERLLPVIPGVICGVDIAAGEIRVDWGADW